MNEFQRTSAAVRKASGWLHKANCRNMDTNLFFPRDGTNLSLFVKEVCQTCPVLEECLWYANESYSSMGYLAGMSDRERRRWRTENKVALGMSKSEWEEQYERSA